MAVTHSMGAAAFWLAILVLGGACHEPSYGSPEYEVRPATDIPWSGARLDLYSTAFAPPANPEFTLGDSVLTAERRDDTTYSVCLPPLRSQQITLEVRFADDTVAVGPLTLHGFRDARLGPPLKGVPHVWPGGGVTSILVADAVGLVRYDVTHNIIAQRWADSLHWSGCNFGPGASFRPDHFVLQPPGCDRLVSWRVSGEPVASDSAPWYCCGWALVEMAPGRWLITVDDRFWVRECSGGLCTLRERFGYSTEDAVLSPRGDRVALGGYYPFGGGPWVLDTGTGDSAFTIPALRQADAAAFSTNGDTLFVFGPSAPDSAGSSHPIVLAVDAAQGTVLDKTVSPGGGGFAAIALDPLQNVLYVAASGHGVSPPILFVFRRSPLEPLAALPVPADEAEGYAVEVGVIAAPLDGVVYVLSIPRIYDPPSSPIAVYRFDRVP